MIKKVIITGLFLGGGYFLIKKLLPNFTKKEFQADIKDYEVKRNLGNTTGGGGSITEQYVRNTQPFAVLMKAGQGNDPSWDFDPYKSEEQYGFKKGANVMII